MRFIGLVSVLLAGLKSVLYGGDDCNRSVPDTHLWQWHYFAAPDIPEGVIKADTLLDQSLELPDGRQLTAVKFKFPESGSINMYEVITPRPEVLARTLLVADFQAAEADQIVLGLGVDWLCRLYANGRVVFDSTGPGNCEIPTDYTNHAVAIDVKQGHNQLVWEVFGGSFRMDVAAKLINMPKLEILYQPWSTFPDAEENAISIIFTASRPTPAAVDYRLKGSDNWKRVYNNLGGQIRRDTAVHHIRLTGLEPDREFEYRAVLLDETHNLQEIPQKEIYTFKSAGSSGKSFSFVATSDLQVDVGERRDFLKAMLNTPEARQSSFFAFVGDVEWTSNFDKNIIEEFVEPYREAVDNQLPLVMVRGNHEIYGRDSNKYFQYFPAPEPGREGYFMFRYGDVCFVVLDFGDDSPRKAAPSTRALHDIEPYLQAQKRWLEKAVTAPMFRDAKFRIVLSHGVPLGDVNTYMPENIRRLIDPLLGSAAPEHRIHLWLGGHVHRPFRSIPLSNSCRSALAPELFHKKLRHAPVGVNYTFPVVVMGGPNGKLDEKWSLSSVSVKVDSNAIELLHRDRTGQLFDHIKIMSDGSVQELYSSEDFKLYNY